MAVDFGEVRSALYAAQDRSGWERLCEVCERADEREWEEQLWPYVERELARWPVALRKMSARWVRQTMELGRTPPAARLGAALKVALTKQSWTGAFDLRRLAQLAHPGLVTASLSVEGLDTLKLQELLDVSAFVSSAQLGGLRELELGGQLVSEDALRRVAHNEALGGLEVFGISGVKLDERLIDALGAAVGRHGIEALRLMGCEGLNERLGRAAFWRQITGLEMGDDKYRGDYDASFSTYLPTNMIKFLSLTKTHQLDIYRALLEGPATDSVEILSLDQCHELEPTVILNRLRGWRLRALRWTAQSMTDEVSGQLEQLMGEGEVFGRVEALDLDMGRQRAFLSVADAIPLPALRTLRLETHLDAAQLAQLARAHLPALRRLHVRLLGATKEECLDAVRMLGESRWAAQLDALLVDASMLYYVPLDGLGALRPGVARHAYRKWDEPAAPLWDLRGAWAA